MSNIKECYYDGGDCCGLCVSTFNCTNCTCHLDEDSYNPSGAGYSHAGNGYCEDEFNKAECDFDGGDCCVPNVNTEYCSECLCLNDECLTCVSIFVSFQNNANVSVGGFKGVYQFSSLVNGKASWTRLFNRLTLK